MLSFRLAVAPALMIEAGTWLGVLGVLLIAAFALVPVEGLSLRAGELAIALYVLIALLVLRGLPDHAGRRRFGLANVITLLRAAATAFIAGMAAVEGELSPHARAGIVLLGLAALLLDGIDGWAARRGQTASRFGARFDMEVDALFILVITILLLRTGQAGAWVLLIGLARYIFVMMGWIWPPLARELPPRFRRKVVCVFAAAATLVALAPVADSDAARVICVCVLASIVYSFAADIAWLLRSQRATTASSVRPLRDSA